MTGSRRLLNRDYSSAGLYFVTICSNFKRCTFGEVEHGGVRLSDLGKIVEEAWTGLAHRTLNVRLHGHVVMPNHVHGIIEIVRGAQQAAPLQRSAIAKVWNFPCSGAAYCARLVSRLK